MTNEYVRQQRIDYMTINFVDGHTEARHTLDVRIAFGLVKTQALALGEMCAGKLKVLEFSPSRGYADDFQRLGVRWLRYSSDADVLQLRNEIAQDMAFIFSQVDALHKALTFGDHSLVVSVLPGGVAVQSVE